MTIDVVISCTRPNLVNDCLKSLAKQTRKPDKILIVVRNFDNDLQNIIDIFKKYNRLNIKTIIVEKPGAVMAANAGIKASYGDILCFIDDDAQASPEWLERIEKYYKYDKIGGVGGRDIVYIDNKVVEKRAKDIGQVTWYGKIIGNHHCIIDKIKTVSHLKGCNMSYRRKLLHLLDEKLSAGQVIAEPYWELEIGLMLCTQGYKIIYDPDIVVYHYPATPTVDWDKRRCVSIHNEVYVLLKYMPLLKKSIYILYTFLIGDRGKLGFIRYIITSLSRLDFKNTWVQFTSATKFKVKGIKDYLIK